MLSQDEREGYDLMFCLNSNHIVSHELYMTSTCNCYQQRLSRKIPTILKKKNGEDVFSKIKQDSACTNQGQVNVLHPLSSVGMVNCKTVILNQSFTRYHHGSIDIEMSAM